MYNTILSETNRKPSVAIVAERFLADARAAATSRGYPSLRILTTEKPPENIDASIIIPAVTKALPNIINALTSPITQAEKDAKVVFPQNPRIAYAGTLKQINEYFYRMNYTDGLPMIPPTEAAVAEMLTGTDLPKDTMIAKMIPQLGYVTVEKIAINAVMAGCLPTYLPVLIAGVKALQIPDARFGTTSVSTASWPPFWILNGPIRNDINLNCLQGALSPGNIANATIGRAMGLIIKNTGGIRQGVEDMGVYGNPGKYTMVTGEDEEHSPWDPISTEYRFKKGDNTICLTWPTASAWTMLARTGTDAEKILKGIADGIFRTGCITIMLNAQAAQTLAKSGYTKKQVVDYAIQNVTKESLKGNLNTARYPNEVKVVVAGGSGGMAIQLFLAGAAGLGPQRVVQKIDLPSNWSQLVAKYKDYRPTYLIDLGKDLAVKGK